jgi:phosphate starvation-inducible protein PhoH and related proteins
VTNTLRQRTPIATPIPSDLADLADVADLEPAAADVARPASPVTDRLVVGENWMAAALFGERNANLKRVERETGVQVHSRGNEVTFVGDAPAVTRARRLLEQLAAIVRAGKTVSADDVSRAAAVLRGQEGANVKEILTDTILVGSRARPIAAKGLAQKRYVDTIFQKDIVFGIGPAGTGKTYLAMALAVRFLMEKRVKRIILTRPAVEAGERLGFLPGSLEEKVSPYLRPLYDALHDMMDYEKADQLVARGLIEIAPIAFMRGRTLNDSFVILDEAQNTTGEQMKMFLTRLGFESKAVITGDVTQIDLPENRKSGLTEAAHILRGVEGIGFCYFTEVDVVRHPLVQEVIKAYDRAKSGNGNAPPRGEARGESRPETRPEASEGAPSAAPAPAVVGEPDKSS